ncbi:MAG TPA: phosphoglycerate kinase [Candidatus Paceibacterota bacterium]|nr:phosphoglycerate kinase [Candidatus Paceibacterota bacterium]
MRTVRDIKKLEGIPVLVRAALNAEAENGVVTNDFRLRAALPTIEYLRSRHAKVILIGHISGAGTETLRPMYEAMRRWIPDMEFCPVSTGSTARAAARALSPGGVLMVENLRRSKGEESNSKEFSAALSDLGDVFVQDSFDVCHRLHASVIGVPEFLPSYAGLRVEAEVKELSKALTPKRPSLAIVGGAKFSTKQPVLKKLLSSYDRVFVGGALANDLMQAAGRPVGKSLVSGANRTELKALLGNRKLLLPLDYVVAPLGKSRKEGRIAEIQEVAPDEAILDNGPKTIAMLAAYAANAKTILWNGPLGNYEHGFVEGTEALAQVVASSTAYSIVGGGDTIAAIESLELSEDFSFISTGGGAMLDFLAKGTLPGLQVLR